MSLVFAMFPDERQRTVALGVIMSCFVGGAAAGPLIGGALLEAFELGGALGIALLGTLGTAIYRDQVTRSIPSDVPANTAASAHDTLGGAVAVAGQLPPGLLDAANVAFMSGTHAAAAVCTLAMIAAAGITARFLRHVPVAAAQAQVEPEPNEGRAAVAHARSRAGLSYAEVP